METNQRIDEMIDRYLSGQMLDNEKIDFELQMSSDVQFRNEVALHSQIVDAIVAKNAKRVLQQREDQIERRSIRRNTADRNLSPDYLYNLMPRENLLYESIDLEIDTQQVARKGKPCLTKESHSRHESSHSCGIWLLVILIVLACTVIGVIFLVKF